MNNFKKIGLSALAGSLVAVSAHAAEFSVSGSASITMDRPVPDKGAATGNDFSMGDSLSFTASGETDGGLGVAVMYEIDGGALDDYDMTLSGDWGSLKFNGSGASSALGAIDDVTPNAYEEAWDIVDYDGTLTVGAPTIIGGGGGANMFIYTSPNIGGATITAAYQNDGGAVAVSNGSYSDFAIKIEPEMVEGLTLGAGAGSVPVAGQDKEKDNSTAYVKYAVGGFTVGYQVSESDHDTASSSLDSTAYGVTYAVNDDFSIGYSYHETEFDNAASNNSDQESTGVSFSYTMGGMTLGGAMNEVDNLDGVATGDYEGYEFNLKFAF